MHWLKVSFINKKPIWPTKFENIKVKILENRIVPNDDYFTFRISPIFPLIPDTVIYNNSKSFKIVFYTFKNPFRILGKIKKSKHKEIKQRIWFSNGLCSVILIYESDNDSYKNLFESIIDTNSISKEIWEITNDVLKDCNYTIQDPENIDYNFFSIIDYKSLNGVARSNLDEFCVNIRLLLPKVATHFPAELDTFKKLSVQVNSLIEELNYLKDFRNRFPESLDDYSPKELKESFILREKINHQNIDRIVQINSALGYVATQALSGCSPILERRSLIRRHSLLGVGNSFLALNRLVRSIEESLSKFPIENIVTNQMLNEPAIPNLKLPYYDDFVDWEKYSINKWNGEIQPRTGYPKLPYFSGRLGFRETEYSISASIHSINLGVSPDWSLLTVTHEMLHGHVRNFLTILFGSGKANGKSKFDFYFENYQKILSNKTDGLTYADSIRSMILFYCASALDLGSISKVPISTKESRDILNHKKENVEIALRDEFRNINEIFVHILDLHYFYAGQLTAYIPLVWRSWSAVPHVRANLRHYILRTLITIASKKEYSGIERFKQSLGVMIEIFENNLNNAFINDSLCEEILGLLKTEHFKNSLIHPFKASLTLVDIVSNLLMSSTIKKSILKDKFTFFYDEQDETFESIFEYRLSPEFHDEKIESPSAYLLGSMIRQLNEGEIDENKAERETALAFLAMVSNN